ncbi:GIY-YIG nuclease family protein [Pseudomonas sp. BN414]|uniref:GIY-YIG nuclease family protein n=1 Tax=Pseudomonas sp. BN414 TaxID=2567888 RepID=UPI002455D15B|nr:GIY-YIG nuclease family protein [Pseudomonas sp. BN414]MDH4567750.1 GIY-YIG nuclease family protein [Pseudomonas sp. BN414]
MARGWVYVITNPAMPGLIKIGYSLKDPVLRAKELNHTGTPHPYVVLYDVLVREPRDLERTLHQRLAQNQEGKEWFRLTVLEAIRHIRDVAAGDILLESGGTTGESSEVNAPGQDQKVSPCEYPGCKGHAEREFKGRQYCLWHTREFRNPKHAAAIRLLREEQERIGR